MNNKVFKLFPVRRYYYANSSVAGTGCDELFETFKRHKPIRKTILLIMIFAVAGDLLRVSAQTNIAVRQDETKQVSIIADDKTNGETNTEKPLVASVLPRFYDPQTGLSGLDLIGKALQANGELIAARLEIEKARARLAQARLRPNPTLDIEQTSGRFLGSAGEGDLSVGATLPLELYGQRKRRIELAQVEITAREADIANRERQLAAEVLTNYAEALAALQAIKITENLLELDLQTTRFVQIRVNEGETPPLELNLLQVEVERLRANRALSEGRLDAALTKLKLLAGIAMEGPLRLSEQLGAVNLPKVPATLETAIEVALRTRPDIRIAQIEEQLAAAGLRLIRAQSRPDLAITTRYTQGISETTIPNLGSFPDRTRTLTFGLSIGLPVFNRNQGAKAEAEIAIRQAQGRRDFAEKIVRSEVTAALQRLQAADRSLAILQTAVLPRSTENLATFRKVYEIGNITITDLIVEQRRLLDANRDLTETLTERLRAQADLQIALGVPFDQK